MNQRWKRRVDRVIDHVRRDPRGDHSLETLARVARFSPYHFQRIFRAVTGETPGRFVRRARLERAAHLMKAAPNRTLGSIALDAGFSSQSGFSRAFRAVYGRPPSQWDRVARLEPGPDAESRRDGPGRFGRPDPPIEARIVRHPAARIAYVRVRDPWRGDPLPSAYERLLRRLEDLGVDWRKRRLFGLSWDHYDATPEERVSFDLGFEIPEDVIPGDSLGVHEIPAVRAVDAHSEGPLLRIAQAWDYLYLEWFPRSSYEPRALPPMKRFRRRPDEIGWDQWDVDCSIALRPLRP
jgi:AraC-like DNA-binding protein/DNA gyrase inhibitor GyrI